MNQVLHKRNITTIKQQMSYFHVSSGVYMSNKNHKIQLNEEPKAQETTTAAEAWETQL